MNKYTPITPKEVDKLLQRFMDGTSTLEEEAQLADFFRTHQVTGEWKAYKEMFELFDQGKVATESKKRTRWWKPASIAAAIALLLSLAFFLSTRQGETPKLMAQADTVKVAPPAETSEKEEQPQELQKKKEEEKNTEKKDTVDAVKEIHRITRPPKTYMAKNVTAPANVPALTNVPVPKEEEDEDSEAVKPDTVEVLPSVPSHVIAQELFSEAPIRDITQPLEEEADVADLDSDMPEMPTEEMSEGGIWMNFEGVRREIQLRGERMMNDLELAINPEEDF